MSVDKGENSASNEEAPPQQAEAYEGPTLLVQSTRAQISLISEGDRRLGLAPGGETDSNDLAVDIKPEWYWQLAPKWRAKLVLQGFAATGVVDVTEETGGSPTDGFLALREAWVDYRGLSDYPGESLRFGRERLEEATGLWWDDDIMLARWIFNTTLLQSTAGIAQKFSEMRTDQPRVLEPERDIARFFAASRWQWRSGHYAGLLLTHAEGYGDQAVDYATRGKVASERDPSLTWIGLSADNGYFDWRANESWQYSATLAAVTGSEQSSISSSDSTGGFTRREQDVDGWAVDLGLRVQLAESPRWLVGGHWAMASGGGDAGSSNGFRQTGIESNRSRFTGSRSLVQRFGEAFQPEWRNLESATVYTSVNSANHWDASLIYQRFWANDVNGVIESDLIEPARPLQSDDLGQALDLVVGYFGDRSPVWHAMDVRLRAGVFFPGDAYGSGADSARHRVLLDFLKRF
ncbi:alginate export family protein [Marinobacter sp. M216]|uniref:Alginate export family protein n=1 Tax=Marinobacter albus TaxID=3030833 RepID=A0ABT7HBC7_9GAMM|nr:alginate export family protein [Marinobacter sp. M216]MDK9557337.1 alginate export family protein [Marinobacter sp. M216]